MLSRGRALRPLHCISMRSNYSMVALAPREIEEPFDLATAEEIEHVRKMPPFYHASVGKLKTFILPDQVRNDRESRALARNMIYEWRTTGIFQIQIPPSHSTTFEDSFKKSKDFFRRSFKEKSSLVNDQSFSGYIASGEEMTDNIADYSEIFTVTKDLPASDSRVQNNWPCHGPTPWPNEDYKVKMGGLMKSFGEFGDKLLRLTALGLGLERPDELVNMTEDGWHHMRVLRFPHCDKTNGKGQRGRGIGSHTDYGLLVIAAQDDVGGLFVRPRVKGEVDDKNWEHSRAGQNEHDGNWLFVPPVPNTLTVFPGDMMQFLTNNFLPSTPHKVGLNTSERYAFAYFHEPNFSTVLEPLPKFREKIHYGTHFTNMFLRNYPQRSVTQRIRHEGGMDVLREIRSAVVNGH